MEKPNNLYYADAISDAIVDAINRTIEQMKQKDGITDPMQLLAGVLLGFMSLQRTMPKIATAIPSIKRLFDAIEEVRTDLRHHFESRIW